MLLSAASGDCADETLRNVFEELNTLDEELAGVDDDFAMQRLCEVAKGSINALEDVNLLISSCAATSDGYRHH